MESQQSKNLYRLNKDYLDVINSKEYSKILNKRINRRLGIRDVANEFITGYFFKRIKTMVVASENNSQIDAPVLTDVTDRVAVYTVIIGGYDTVKEPLYISKQCDYYIVSDSVKQQDNSVWNVLDISSFFLEKNMSNTEKARFIKTHPHVFFRDYKYSIFIDGNFLIVTDMVPLVNQLGSKVFATHLHPSNDCIYTEAKDIIALGKAKKEEVLNQISMYKKEGFPRKYGLFETNVLVREHNNPDCVELDESWWEEMTKYTMRDQLSLTYILWKKQYGFSFVRILGNNPRNNPRFRYLPHMVR